MPDDKAKAAAEKSTATSDDYTAAKQAEKPDESTSAAGSSSGSGSAYPPPAPKAGSVAAGSKGYASETSDPNVHLLLAELEQCKMNNDKDGLKDVTKKLTDLGYKV